MLAACYAMSHPPSIEMGDIFFLVIEYQIPKCGNSFCSPKHSICPCLASQDSNCALSQAKSISSKESTTRSARLKSCCPE